jgi:hypothetical protein
MSAESLVHLTFKELQARAQSARHSAKTTRKAWKDKRRGNTEQGSLGEQDLLTELGDCYGVKGGTYRDWGRYLEAAEAYETGRACEERLNEISETPNSYCLVQHLVNLILADPSSVSEGEQVHQLEVKAGLAKARDTIRQQMQVKRKDDPWAQADLALVSQLLGDDVGLERDNSTTYNRRDLSTTRHTMQFSPCSKS